MNSSLKNLSIKNLKMNKSKSRLTTIAIVLSTCLITAISIFCYSLQQEELNRIRRATGDYYVAYHGLTNEQAEQLKLNKELVKTNRHVVFGGNNDYLPYRIQLISIDQEENLDSTKVIEGKWPQKESEIAIPQWMLEEMDKGLNLGDKIKLNYKFEDYKLHEKYEETREFTISAITKEDEDRRRSKFVADFIVSREFADKNINGKNCSINIYAKCKDRNIEETVKKIGIAVGLKEDQINVNSIYLNALGESKEAIIPFLIMSTVVVLATAIVIYTIFYISIKERVTQLGILAALGATKKQIRKLILREGLILSLIAIPLGLLLGYGLSYILIPMIPLNEKLTVRTSPIIVIGVLIIVFITMVISLRKPSKIASKISPVEAMRYTGIEQSGKKKERKSKGNISVYKLAYLNVLRNKKRTFMTVISMTVTGILFITFYSAAQGIRSRKENHITYPIELRSSNLNDECLDKGTDPLNKELLEGISQIDGVRNIGILKYVQASHSDKNIIRAVNSRIKREEDKVKDSLLCAVFGYNDFLLNSLKDRIIEGELNLAKLKSDNIVILEKNRDKDDNNLSKVGDKLLLTVEKQGVKKDIEVTIGAIVTHNVRSLNWSFFGPDIIMNETKLTELIGEKRISEICIDIQDKDLKSVKKGVSNLVQNNKELELFDQLEFKKKKDSEFKTMGSIALSVVLIIGFIGALNTVNTMNTSILARKKEFGMLEAVGTTSKQLKKLFRLEGLYYSLAGGISSAIFGTILSYLLSFYLKEIYGENGYTIPLIGIVIVIVVFIMIQLLITFFVERKLRKDSIVEKIRFNE